MDELLDVLNEDLDVIGQDTRKNVHEKELLHAAFHCWLFQKHQGKIYIYFQMRNSKVSYPNLLDITAAGHLASGEGPVEGAREIREELGVNIPYHDLISIGQFRDALPLSNNKIDNEWCHLFIYSYKEKLETLTLQKSEVDSIVCVPMEDFKEILLSKEPIDVNALTYDGEEVEAKTYRLTLANFVPHKIEYYQYIIDKIGEVAKQ
jgi:isopentenyldiphosphate isomerase